MTQSALMSLDEILETAFEIFAEMAPDNLEYDDLAAYESHFEDDGGAIVVEVGSDWPEHVGSDINLAHCAEVQIGMAKEGALADVFVRMLLSRDPEEKFCHLLWKRSPTQLH